MKEIKPADLNTLKPFKACRFVRYEDNEGNQNLLIGEAFEMHRDLVARALGIPRALTAEEAKMLAKTNPGFKDMGMIMNLLGEFEISSRSSQLEFPSQADLPQIRQITILVFEKKYPGMLFVAGSTE